MPYIITNSINKFEFENNICYKKDDAKKAASFEAVLKLFQLGYINQNLKPKHAR